MKRIFLFLVMSMLMTGSAFAECLFTIDDFSVTSDQVGTEIELCVKAEFSARVSGWDVYFTYPEGLTPTYAEMGDDMIISYINQTGNTRIYTPFFNNNNDYTRFMGFTNIAGYWYDPAAGGYTSYGLVKWEGGTYEEMFFLYLEVSDAFHGGEIIIETQCASDNDARGGTILENGDNGVSFTSVCNVTFEEPIVEPEAYACYTSSNTTLTFYYDDQSQSRPGTIYELNLDYEQPDWCAVDATKVVFDPSFANARPTTTYEWFFDMYYLQTIIGMAYLNTSEVTIMRSMFEGCEQLTSLDLSNFNTAKVTDMDGMFCDCTNLTSLDLSSFNTVNVTYMNGMFVDCKKMASLDVSSFNTANVTDMNAMFLDCCLLTSLDLSSFNTANVTAMDRMFDGCINLATISVSDRWSTASVNSSYFMFDLCRNLVGGLGTAWNSSNPTDKTYAHIDGGTANPGYFTDINAARAYACYTPSNNTLTFYYDTEFGTRPGTSYNLNVGNENPAWTSDGTYSSVTNVVFDPSFASARPTTTYDWFGVMEGVVSITGLNYLNTSEVTNMAFMFYGCTGLRSLDLSGFNTSKVTDMSSMFNHCNSLTSLDLSSFNTARVTDMSMMFQTCLNLVTIYVGSGWTTAAVASSDNMFYDSRRIVGGQGTTYNSNHIDKTYAHIDGGPSNPGYFTDIQIAMQPYVALSGDGTTLTFYKDGKIATHTEPTFMLNEPDQTPGWNIYSNVTTVVFDPSFAPVRPTYMGDWFNGLRYLTSIQGLENLNTSEVTSMKSLFNGCTSLVNLDLRYFETGNVTDMNSMFRDCSSLRQLDLPSFDTRKVTDMNTMFRGCTSLESLDLSSFDTHSVTRMIWMFYNCSNLTTIYVGDNWDTAGVTSSSSMFANCTSLVGGKGTAYSSSNPKDKTYAHIDGGTSNPGYFTGKGGGLRGDVNGDGKVNISDVTALINLLLAGNTPPSTADCNQDGKVNIADVTALINYLLSGTW